MEARALPSGTVTFLFTDIEGSTRLWHAYPDAMRLWLARHDQTMTAVVSEHGGVVFKHTGDGACAAFAVAGDAVAAALDAQARLGRIDVPIADPVRVRAGLHAGEARPEGNDYFGPPLNRCARLRDLGHGGQTLCSGAVTELVRDFPDRSIHLVDLGRHALRDLPGTEHVFEARRDGDTPQFPPLRSHGALPDRLPRPPSAFIGREAEVSEVCALLEQTRVLTLLGPGGVGKTRLAIQAAAARYGSFDLGACFVDLATTDDPGRVELLAAEALNIVMTPGRTARDELVAHIGESSLLMLVDNCEHVLDASARMVDALLRMCPNLAVLATSREPLRLRGERVVPISALSSGQSSADERDDAVQLFIDRAERVGGTVPRADLPIVAEICNHLDGMPLAIELAAARSRHLSPAQILDRLGDRFKLLRTSERDVDDRHRTLRAAIDWSYELLDDREQCLFRRLAVFSGDFHLEPVEEICAFGDIMVEDVIDLVASLVDRSLVVSADGRYSMLETVRAYADEHLDRAGERDVVDERHFEYFAVYARGRSRFGAEPPRELRGSLQARDVAMLRDALEWAITHDLDRARAFFADAWLDFLDAGAWSDFPRWMAALAPHETTPDVERVSLVSANAYWLQLLGDMAGAYDGIASILPLARTIVQAAVPLLLVIQGVAAQASGRDDPIALFELARARASELGDFESEMEATAQLGEYLLNLGRLEEADTVLAAAVALARGNAPVFAFSGAALTALFLGDTERALRLAESCADAAADATSFPQLYARLTYALAVAAAGNGEEAASAISWVIEGALRYEVPLMLGDAFAAAAGVAAFAGDAPLAATLLGAARTEFGRANSWRRPSGGAIYVHFGNRARAALNPDEYEAARRRGRALARADAVELVTGGAAPRD